MSGIISLTLFIKNYNFVSDKGLWKMDGQMMLHDLKPSHSPKFRNLAIERFWVSLYCVLLFSFSRRWTLGNACGPVSAWHSAAARTCRRGVFQSRGAGETGDGCASPQRAPWSFNPALSVEGRISAAAFSYAGGGVENRRGARFLLKCHSGIPGTGCRSLLKGKRKI